MESLRLKVKRKRRGYVLHFPEPQEEVENQPQEQEEPDDIARALQVFEELRNA